MSTPTLIWAVAHNPTSGVLFTSFTISAVPSSLAYSVVRMPLPLHRVPAESTTATTDSSVTPMNSGSNIAATPAPVHSGLSPGAAAGIVVGTAIGILAVAALLILFLLRRRRRRPFSNPPPIFDQPKPELPASEAVLAKPRHSSPPEAPKVTLSPPHLQSGRGATGCRVFPGIGRRRSAIRGT